MGVGMTMGMGMTVGMGVDMTVGMNGGVRRMSIAPQKQTTPQAGNDHARDTPKPRVETLRDDVV
jgi:hypothetical protein